MKATAWIATMTEGEYSDTCVYFLGVFDAREEAEAAVDERYAERHAKGWRGVGPMLDWQRTESESTRATDGLSRSPGEPARAAVTCVELGARVEIGLY